MPNTTTMPTKRCEGRRGMVGNIYRWLFLHAPFCLCCLHGKLLFGPAEELFPRDVQRACLAFYAIRLFLTYELPTLLGSSDFESLGVHCSVIVAHSKRRQLNTVPHWLFPHALLCLCCWHGE